MNALQLARCLLARHHHETGYRKDGEPVMFQMLDSPLPLAPASVVDSQGMTEVTGQQHMEGHRFPITGLHLPYPLECPYFLTLVQ